jgi:RND family efflux transporter MFP subunit
MMARASAGLGREKTGRAGGVARRLALAGGAILLLGLAACGGDHEASRPPRREVACRTFVVQAGDLARIVTATGSLEAAKTIPVSTRMMGWVRQIHVAEGGAVQAGAPLITIDNTDLLARKAQVEAAIAEAEAVLANAETMAARFEKLYADKSVSKQQLDDVLTGRERARAGLEAARAQRQEIDVQLRYLDITAPATGIVARKLIEEGAMANPGAPLLILERNERMKVIAQLSERDVNAVAAGDTVTVAITSLPQATFRVPIDKIIPAADPGSRTYAVESYLPNPEGRLKSGMFARVSIPVGRRPAVVAPAQAVFSRGQLRGVFVVDREGFARLRWVRLGHETGDDVEILAGIDPGETIVLSSEVPLTEGDRVVP